MSRLPVEAIEEKVAAPAVVILQSSSVIETSVALAEPIVMVFATAPVPILIVLAEVPPVAMFTVLAAVPVAMLSVEATFEVKRFAVVEVLPATGASKVTTVTSFAVVIKR
jgi:hypothetical protein